MSEFAVPLNVQVCYARPDRQFLLEMRVASGTTLEQAIRQSGVLAQAPEIDLTVCGVGIFGKLKTLDTVLRDCDRVEIYRSLVADPKDARRRRAGKKKA
jgi:putative ubiquitin-RnfH superfamily antitoxin RatB of RatAB toxin-antitoxin module